MRLQTRKLLDRTSSAVGMFSILLMASALVVLLGPIFVRGIQAFLFRGTVEYRRLMWEQFGRGDRDEIRGELSESGKARAPVYRLLARFESEISAMDGSSRREYREKLKELKEMVRTLFGPFPGESQPALLREQYGQTRWDRARIKMDDILYAERWDYSNTREMGKKIRVARREEFRGTSLEGLFPLLEQNEERMLLPRLTFYWRFLLDESKDAHFFGGIWPEMLGTIYLAIGAMILAVPLGIMAAIYLAEFAGSGRIISLLRTFVSTLAGVPSIVFGLFGLAFFIQTMRLSRSKSVLAGAATLALLILPTIIRASEEAIRAVPGTYKEAGLSLGATRWHMVLTVILPAALPGILTGIIISIGRAAGETAPIIFTAAVSVGRPLKLWETLRQPTPALPWNIYNLATEHAAVNEIRHVQYGMLLTLVVMVLVLNLAAILLRARISKKMRG